MARFFDFFKKKEEELKRILGVEAYDDLCDPNNLGHIRINITKPIKQSDLRRIFRYYPKFDSLTFNGIDISRLNLSVIPYQTNQYSSITFIRTKAGRKTFTNLPQSRMGTFNFEGIDFSESPVVLPNPQTSTLSIKDCKNLSNIKNLHLIGVGLKIDNSDISDINLYFPHLSKLLAIYNLPASEERTSLEELKLYCPDVESLEICDCPKLTKFGNIEPLRIKSLLFRRTGLTDINNFGRIFQGADEVYLWDNEKLVDITPLERFVCSNPKHISLSGCISIGKNMGPVIRRLRERGIKVDIRRTQLENDPELFRVTKNTRKTGVKCRPAKREERE